MMATDWLGSIVSINCGESLGVYQGRVSAVDQVSQTISLTRPFHNGVKCLVPEVTFRLVSPSASLLLPGEKHLSSFAPLCAHNWFTPRSRCRRWSQEPRLWAGAVLLFFLPFLRKREALSLSERESR